MPNLRGAHQRENAEQHVRNNLQRDRCHEQFFPIEGVGNRAGEESEYDKRQRFEKAGETQFQRGTGSVIDLIEGGNIADLARKRAQHAGDPQQSIVADQ